MHADDQIGTFQRGGVATIVHEDLAAFVNNSSMDSRGLGSWAWYMLEWDPGHKTYVISVYAPWGMIHSAQKETVMHKHPNYI